MHRSSTRRVAVLVGVTALLLAACGGAPAATTVATPTPAETPTAMPDMTHAGSPSASATASPSPEPTEAASGGDVEVVVGMSSFSPTQLTIDAGTEVTFTNNSGLPHTVTHGTGGQPVADPAFDRPLGDGGVVTIAFDEPGTYDVTCKIHPTMQMTITVEG